MTSRSDWYRGKYPPSLIEVAAIHDLFYNLGYSLVEEVLPLFQSEDVLVGLQADGCKAWFRIGAPELTAEEMFAKWQEFVDEWNTGGIFSNEEKEMLWQSSTTKRNVIGIVTKLALEGFRREPRDLRKLKKMH